jgi:hypothetical protein
VTIVGGRTHRRRSSSTLRVNLLLVPVGPTYRPALPISQRPELAAAFARGVEARASEPTIDEARTRWLMGLSADEVTAYSLGRRGAEALQAPAPIAVAAVLLVMHLLADTWLRMSRRRRDKLWVTLAVGAVALCDQRIAERARKWRARKLGLTVETAPRPGNITVTLSQLLGRIVLVWIQQLWVRHRTGRWARLSASSIVAAGAIREVQLRRDWNAAYTRSREHRRRDRVTPPDRAG